MSETTKQIDFRKLPCARIKMRAEMSLGHDELILMGALARRALRASPEPGSDLENPCDEEALVIEFAEQILEDLKL